MPNSAFDLILVRWLKLSDSKWKKIEYIWLGTAALGILTASTQAGRFIGINSSRNTEPVLQAGYSEVRGILRSTFSAFNDFPAEFR
jgi:hypothetical protein